MCDCSTQKNALHVGITAKSLISFRRSLRAHVRKYWKGYSTSGDFIFGFHEAVEFGFMRAFRLGAASCGVKPADYTQKMKNALQSKINEQFTHIMGLADDIVIQADGGKLSAAFRRIEIWVARYGEVKQLGTLLACGDKPLEWVIGIAEHCKSCLKLNGKVKRASFWENKGILPRVAGATYLDCKGYNCKCSLLPTDKPLSKGKLPSLP